MKVFFSFLFLLFSVNVQAAPICARLFDGSLKEPEPLEALYYNAKELLRYSQEYSFREAWPRTSKRIDQLLNAMPEPKNLDSVMMATTLKTLRDLYDSNAQKDVPAQLRLLDQTIIFMAQTGDREFQFDGKTFYQNDKVSGVFGSRIIMDMPFVGHFIGVRKAVDMDGLTLNLVIETSERNYLDFPVKNLREMKKAKK